MAKGRAGGSWSRVDPLTSLLFVFPLFLFYELGVLLVPSAYNGADLLTSEALHLLHGRVQTYIAVNAGLAALFVVAALVLRKRHHFDPGRIGMVLLESSIYALGMGTFILFVMMDLLHIDPRLAIPALRTAAAAPQGFLPVLIVSIGAGVHEELLFRVGMVGGLVWLLTTTLKRSRGVSIAVAFFVSSVLFSAAHHVIGGEPFRIGVFVYRMLCGLVFAAIYQVRGFAVAVYTHALYDVYVFALG